MKRLSLITLLFLLPVLASGQSWDSLNSRGYPRWFADAKLGIFVHWGLYSVPAYASPEGYAEWFYRGLMTGDTARQRVMSRYADTSLPVLDQYRTLTEYWKAERWQPNEWATLFSEAGARYVVLVTKHHDGFCLWDSPLQPQWNSVVSGPRRNIVAELTAAVRSHGMRMGFYYSLPEWTNRRHIWMHDPDSLIGDYVDNYMVPQFKELVSRYRPSLIFADGDWLNSASQFRSVELIDWYYRTVGDSAIVNNRWGNGTLHGFKTPEYSSAILDTATPWAECRGIGRSFGYNRNEPLGNYLTEGELIRHFCELVAHGGGLTLNVGPMADGTIPEIQRSRLQALGRWLRVNGEAIYGSRSWRRKAGGSSASDTVVAAVTELMSAPLPPSDSIGYDWVRNAPLPSMPADNFTVHWHGTFVAPAKGNYRFKAVADDEMTVVAGADTLLYYNHSWAGNSPSRPISLDRGQRLELDIHYREKDLEASAALYVSRDDGLYTAALADWHGTATWQRTLRCFTTRDGSLYVIEFSRPGRSLTIPDMPPLPKNSSVTLLGATGKISWRQRRDGALILDLSTLDYDELNALDHAWVLKLQTEQ